MTETEPPYPDEVRLTQRLRSADFSRYITWRSRHRRLVFGQDAIQQRQIGGVIVGTFVGLLLGLILAFAPLFGLRLPSPPSLTPLALLALLVGAAVLFMVVINIGIALCWAHYRRHHMPIDLHLDPAGVHYRSPAGDHQVPWSEYRFYVPLRDLVALVSADPHRPTLISTQRLTPEDREALTHLLASHLSVVPARAATRPSPPPLPEL